MMNEGILPNRASLRDLSWFRPWGRRHYCDGRWSWLLEIWKVIDYSLTVHNRYANWHSEDLLWSKPTSLLLCSTVFSLVFNFMIKGLNLITSNMPAKKMYLTVSCKLRIPIDYRIICLVLGCHQEKRLDTNCSHILHPNIEKKTTKKQRTSVSFISFLIDETRY